LVSRVGEFGVEGRGIDGFLIKTIGNEVLEGRGIWSRGSGNLVSRVGELTVSL
jgi:hypothetical protein